MFETRCIRPTDCSTSTTNAMGKNGVRNQGVFWISGLFILRDNNGPRDGKLLE